MMKHAWLFAIAALVCLSVSCGEVESCREIDTPGCLNSVPRPDGTCLFDLVLSAGVCTKQASQNACSFCPDGALCVAGKCVDLCAAADHVLYVPPPEPIYCRATNDPAMPGVNPSLSFEEVCKRKCLLAERAFGQFCPGYMADPTKCEKPEVLTSCIMQCPKMTDTGGRDLTCLTALCEDVRLSQCKSNQTCPNEAKVDCSGITCTNDCAPLDGKSLVGDGTCEDGDLLSAADSSCLWGSDCIDCGARRGPVQQPLPLGSVCSFQSNCAGFTGKLATTTAWCVANTALVPHCVPDCSRGQDCPVGFECRKLNLAVETVADGGVPTALGCTPKRCP